VVDPILVRLERSRQDPTRLAYGAYWVHAAVCGAFGGEAGAAKALGVSANVLKQLKRIANKHDPDISRKPAGPVAPIGPRERAWLLEAMRVLADRAGRTHSLAPPSPLTLADLPPLPQPPVSGDERRSTARSRTHPATFRRRSRSSLTACE
jgi:hypothetical protein